LLSPAFGGASPGPPVCTGNGVGWCHGGRGSDSARLPGWAQPTAAEVAASARPKARARTVRRTAAAPYAPVRETIAPRWPERPATGSAPHGHPSSPPGMPLSACTLPKGP
jgi:hypothetical protein